MTKVKLRFGRRDTLVRCLPVLLEVADCDIRGYFLVRHPSKLVSRLLEESSCEWTRAFGPHVGTSKDLSNCFGISNETYVIKGERGSGVLCSNGAAAHLVNKGDKVIILAFAQLHTDELAGHKPRIVVVGPNNTIDKIQVSPD